MQAYALRAVSHPDPWSRSTPPWRSRARRAAPWLVAAFGCGALVVVGIILVPVIVDRLDREIAVPFEFDVPSQSRVTRDVNDYYASNTDGKPRPRGEFAGCPEETREAGTWYFCEFDYPTREHATDITCTHVWVEGASTWEDDSRRHLRGAEIPRARATVQNGAPSVCDSI